MIKLTINGKNVPVADGTTVAAAILNHGLEQTRPSANSGERRPLCGMGICFECRVTIDGVKHERSCMIAVRDGMEVVTGE